MPGKTPSTATSSTDNGNSNQADGPGEPGEALAALVSELAKMPTATEPDKAVARAVATGWHAREALAAARKADEDHVRETALVAKHPGHAITALEHVVRGVEHAFIAPAPPAAMNGKPLSFVGHDDGAFLVDVGSLGAGDRIRLVCAQLTADLAALESRLKDAGQDGAPVTVAIKELHDSAHDRQTAACNVGAVFAQGLLAADFRLGKAYSLGWDMASLAQELPKNREPATFKSRLENNHDGIRMRLRMLASLLPPHVGHSVRRSLDDWTERYCGIAPREDGVTYDEAKARQVKQTAEAIRPRVTKPIIDEQVQLWRALLTGEKAAKDVLHADDLVSVSAKTMGRLAHAIGNGLKQAKLAAMLLGGAAVALVAIGATLITQGGSGGDVAGVTALVGSLGLTWKGLGSTIGRGLAKLEQPVWDAEVDEVIAASITLLPEPPTQRPKRRLWNRHERGAPACDERTGR